MIAVGIITAPRAKPTLCASFESYMAAGFECQTHIFAEPGVQDFPQAANVQVHQNETRRGNFRNWVRALEQLLITSEPWLMVCEDDISWAQKSQRVLEEILPHWVHDDAGAISLYLPIRMSKLVEPVYGAPLPRGWYGLNLGRKTWGAQCLLFRRAWAEALLQDQMLRDYIADPKWDKNVDALVAEVLLKQERKIMYRVPCLVHHNLGNGNSSLGYPAVRPDLETKYFKGVAA